MDKIYIFGHKQPDTDSVCSAIALSHLKNELGLNTEPRILGDLNSETKFILNYFDIKAPLYLNDVRLQIRNLEYGRGNFCYRRDSLYNATVFMRENQLSSIPIVDENQKLTGLLSMKDITNKLLTFEENVLYTSYENLITTLKGEEILRFDDEIQGDVLVPSYSSTTFINDVVLDRNSIIVLGDRHSLIEYAVNSAAKLIIITGGSRVKDEHLELAKEKKVNIIQTSLRTFNVVKILDLCNYVESLKADANVNRLVVFNHREYVKNFLEETDKLRFRVYPVINNSKECTGTIQLGDVSTKKKKKVILVDHNEIEQSVDGLEEAEIIEIVDHHKIGDIGTIMPINFRNMPVGSTATIIYLLYKENNVDIPKNIAGLLLASIISDTLLFKSPTTTVLDKETAYSLAEITDLDVKTFAREIYENTSSLKEKTAEEVVFSDLKIFNINNRKIGIGQISISNIDEIDRMQQEIEFLLEDAIAEYEYNLIALFATDAFMNGSYLYFNESSRNIWEEALGIEELTQGYFVPDIISRKKQIIPKIVSVLE